MLRLLVLLGITTLLGCASYLQIVTETEDSPHYVIVRQNVGIDSSYAALRVGADNKADAACQKYERHAKFPASAVDCANWHPMLRYCIVYQYAYECEERP